MRIERENVKGNGGARKRKEKRRSKRKEVKGVGRMSS